MVQIKAHDLASEDGVRPLLVVTAAAAGGCSSIPYKPLGFKKLVLCVCFVIGLKRTTAPPPVNQPSTNRTSSSRSFTAVEVDAEGEGDEIREIERPPIERIVKERNLEALKRCGGVEAAVSFLLSESPAQVTHIAALLLIVTI